MSDKAYRELEKTYAASPTMDNLSRLIVEARRLGLTGEPVTREQVLELFKKFEDVDSWRKIEDIVYRTIPGDNSIEIKVTSMYSNPINCNYDLLKGLMDLFKTTTIDVDDYDVHGCDSCDWGSAYGHTFQIRNCFSDISELLRKES
jgi:hypothetical protein